MRLHLGPAALILGQSGFATVFQLHQVDDRQVDLAVIDRPMDHKLPPVSLHFLDPVAFRVVVGPEQLTLQQFLVIEPLRQRELQLGGDFAVADDGAHHVGFQLVFGWHIRQMHLRLLRVIGHGQQFCRHRKPAVALIHGEAAKEPPRIAPDQQVFHGKRAEGVEQPREIARHDPHLLFRDLALGLHRRGHAQEVNGDHLEFAEIAARGESVGQGDMVLGGVSVGMHQSPPFPSPSPSPE